MGVPLDLVAMDCCITEVKFLSIKILGVADLIFDSVILKVSYPGWCVRLWLLELRIWFIVIVSLALVV